MSHADDKSIYSAAALKVSPLRELTVAINTHKKGPRPLIYGPGTAGWDTVGWKVSGPSFLRLYGPNLKRQHPSGRLDSNEK